MVLCCCCFLFFFFFLGMCGGGDGVGWSVGSGNCESFNAMFLRKFTQKAMVKIDLYSTTKNWQTFSYFLACTVYFVLLLYPAFNRDEAISLTTLINQIAPQNRTTPQYLMITKKTMVDIIWNRGVVVNSSLHCLTINFVSINVKSWIMYTLVP